MNFPIIRKRRLRKTAALRELVAETRLSAKQLIYPLFVHDGTPEPVAVESMPGVFQHSVESVVQEVEQAMASGIRSVMLFGVPSEKDQEGTAAWFEAGVVQQATRRLKKAFGDDLVVITDTCLCEYTSHGHCGVLLNGTVLNDPSLDLLARAAISQLQAGADMVAPSDMMDGRIAYIRDAMDDAGFDDKILMAYSAKFASSFYGPFRDAAGSTPISGDRKSYQMDPANGREALEEVRLDIEEGADIVMVKPAMAYLDVVHQVRELTRLPVAAYSVSGEYSMIKAAAEKGWINEQNTVLEVLTGISRAGADLIITYYARQAATWLNQER
jgi:porphobilinogen synthase